MGSKRTIITLTEEDKLWLERYSQVRKISMAEAIRKGIQRLKLSESEETYKYLLEKTRGIWKKEDGLKYQTRLRSEWSQDDRKVTR